MDNLFSIVCIFGDKKTVFSATIQNSIVLLWEIVFFSMHKSSFSLNQKKSGQTFMKKKSFNSLTLLRIYRYNARQYAYLFVDV